MNVYGFDDYNQHGSLRVSGWMWFWIIYSMRHAILWLGLSISHTPDMIDELTEETHWAYLLCGIPGLMLMVDAGFRIPDAGVFPRWIWRNGGRLLIATLVLHILIVVGLGLSKPVWEISGSQILFFAIDALGLRFALKSQRVKDVFADFPPPVEKEKKNQPDSAEKADAEQLPAPVQTPAESEAAAPVPPVAPEVLQVGVVEAIEMGIRYHQSGQHAMAEQVYVQILANYPDNADALHLMGVLNHQRGIRDEAERYILKAIALQPNAAVYYGNLGRVYQAQGRMAEAISRYEQALQLQPDFPDAKAGLESLRGRAWLQARN